MMLLPEPLREKLGTEAADGLVTYVHTALGVYRAGTIELVEERFARRLAESESRLRGELHESESRLRGELHESESRLRGEVQDTEVRIRKDMNDGFQRLNGQIIRIHEKFAGMQNQITVQTRWIIAGAGFIAGASKLFDAFIK